MFAMPVILMKNVKIWCSKLFDVLQKSAHLVHVYYIMIYYVEYIYSMLMPKCMCRFILHKGRLLHITLIFN